MHTDLYLLRYIHSVSPVVHGPGVLALNRKTPKVVQTFVGMHFLQVLQIFMELADQTTGQDLAVFCILFVLLCVQESVWDLVLVCILHNGDHIFHLILWALLLFLWGWCVLSSTSLSISLSHTLNCSDSKAYFLLPIDIGVEYSQNAL